MTLRPVAVICVTVLNLAACGSSSKSPSGSVDSGTPPGGSSSGTAWCTNTDDDAVRIVDLAKGTYTSVDLQPLSPGQMGSIALNSTDAWVVAYDENNRAATNVVQISRATQKVVTKFLLDSSDPGVDVRSIAASDSAVWLAADGSNGPTLYKINTTSSPTGYAVKASVAAVNQTTNNVLIGSEVIWLLVSNNSEIFEINASNPTSTASDLLVGNGTPEVGAMTMDATNLYLIDGYGHLYSVPQSGFPNITPSAPSTATFFTPIRVGGDGLYVLPADGSKQISVVDKTHLTVTRTIGPASDAVSTFAISGSTLAAAVGDLGETLQVFDTSSGATVAQIPGVYADDLVLE
jgi:hypothetical protein